MKHQFVLEQTQDLPITLAQAWEFFSSPKNLSKITPPSLGFVIKSNPPEDMVEGLQITYTVKPLMGIPMKWVSLIKEIEKPYQFVDQQLVGPYAYWHHLHRFKEIPGGVRCDDIVTYALPMGSVGAMMQPFLVAPRLKEIFDFRRKVLIERFGVITT